MPDPTPVDWTDALTPDAVVALAALVGRDGLTDDERRVLDEALTDARASELLTELRSVVVQLPPTPPAPEDAVPAPPDDLRRRVLTAVAAEGRRAPRTWLPSVAAAAIAVLVGVGLGRASVPGPPAVPIEQLALEVASFAVTDADLIAHTWGTELLFTFDGTETGESYTVVVTATDGTVFAAGSFLGDGTRTVDCEMNVALLREDAASFTVTDEDGVVVVAGDLPAVG